VICDYAAEANVDMIIVGAQGKGAIRRLVLGSTLQQVQRLSTVPVLAVKDPASKMGED
jgi:nucleotide-binding universal stress UspA family protein